LTNNSKLPAETIAALYKARLEIELSFKWIKQNLRVKTFYGTSPNAVTTQIWIAMIVYLVLAILKQRYRLDTSLSKVLHFLEVNLFAQKPLISISQVNARASRQMFDKQLTLIDWLIMGFGLLAKEQSQEGLQESFSSIFCVMNELEKAEIERKILLRDPPVRSQPGTQQGPKTLHGVDVNLVEAVAVLITGILASAMAYALVFIAPFRQSSVDIVLVGEHERTGQDRFLNQGPDRCLTYVLEHVYDDLAPALDHPEDGRLLLFQRAAAACAFEAVATPLTAFFLPPLGVPCDLPSHRLRHTRPHR
jgi:hypothetical protein